MNAEECFYFGAFLRVSGTVATLPHQREPSPDEKKWKVFFFFLHIQIQKYDCLPVYVEVFQKKKNQSDNQIPVRSKFHSSSCRNVLFLLFQKKSPHVSRMSVASNIVRVVCNFIYLTRPSAPKAPNSTSPCTETESIVSKNWIVPHDSFQTKSVRLSMSCAVFSDRAKELRLCSWGFSLIQKVLVQIRCLSELDVQIKSSRGLPWKQQLGKIHDYSIPKRLEHLTINTVSQAKTNSWVGTGTSGWQKKKVHESIDNHIPIKNNKTTTTGCVHTFRLSVATSQREPHLFFSQQLSSCIDRQYLLTRGPFSATVQPALLLTSQLVLLTHLWFTWTINTHRGMSFLIFWHWTAWTNNTHWIHFTESDFFLLLNLSCCSLNFSGIFWQSCLFPRKI